ncbi:helix-turn-helix transcriptional regulator [Lactococcus fujiensis]|uniref:Repressor n=2 Tax=Lactococcus fujiensis TaxID=610251 RepID=A0A2A5RJ03_9LACT|nr:helix-turn-helix transcriptional regulator [Lactococcus fujiensis]PCR99076.1 Repressor [Lactococcus fujiensis JCM 16395]
MSGSLGNKEVMAKNIEKYMKRFGLDRYQLAEITGSSYFTVTAWLKARTYPRIDKIEIMARYFNISKAELVEENNTAEENSPLIEKTVSTMKQLNQPRQEKVFNFTTEQLNEQVEESKVSVLDDYRLSDEYLLEQISKASAYGGGELNDNDKEFFKRLLRNTLKDKIEKGEI